MKKNHALDWKKVFNISLLCLSFGMIIYFCVKDNNLAILIQSFSSLNFFWLIPAVLLIAGVWALEALLYHLIVNSVYPGQYSWKEAFRVTMVGQYFSAVTPFGVAGQPMQLVALSRQGVSSGVAVSVVVRKFLIYQTTLSLYSLGVILLKSSFFESQIHGFLPLALVGFLAQAASVLLLFLFSVSRTFTTKLIQFFFWLLSKLRLVKRPEEKSKRVHAQLESYLNNNKSMNHNWKLSLQLYGLTFLELTVLFSVPFFLYKAYHNPGAPYFRYGFRPGLCYHDRRLHASARRRRNLGGQLFGAVQPVLSRGNRQAGYAPVEIHHLLFYHRCRHVLRSFRQKGAGTGPS